MLPERFNLTYVGKDGEEHRPVMIHRGIVGTMERFIAYLTEIYKGAFPTWLAPTQAVLIPVNNDLHLDYVNRIKKQMLAAGLRVKVDDRNEKMGYKIREAQTKKIPYTVVVGDKELNDAARRSDQGFRWLVSFSIKWGRNFWDIVLKAPFSFDQNPETRHQFWIILRFGNTILER